MADFSPERIRAKLERFGINIDALAHDDAVFERAVTRVYKSIPIPLRWFVRKKRVRKGLELVRSAARRLPPEKDDQAARASDPTAGRGLAEGS